MSSYADDQYSKRYFSKVYGTDVEPCKNIAPIHMTAVPDMFRYLQPHSGSYPLNYGVDASSDKNIPEYKSSVPHPRSCECTGYLSLDDVRKCI